MKHFTIQLLTFIVAGLTPSFLAAQADHVTPITKVEDLTLTLLGDASLQFLPFSRGADDGTDKTGAVAGGAEINWPVNRLQARWNLINTTPDKLGSLQGIGHNVLLPQIGSDFTTIEVEHQLITSETDSQKNFCYTTSSWSNALYLARGNWLSSRDTALDPISATIVSLGSGVRATLHKEFPMGNSKKKNTLDLLASLQLSARFALSEDISQDQLQEEYLQTKSTVFPGLVLHTGMMLNGFGVTVNITYFDDVKSKNGLPGATGFNFTIGLLLRGNVVECAN